jgi:EmrB/QacA subfamily drug resistance transporter
MTTLETPMPLTLSETRARWLAFGTLCCGELMIVLDSTVVNVALPSISDALGFTKADLTWVVNSYLLTFGGFLLLGGRLADLYGARKLFVLGVIAFTIASLACGLAPTPETLVIARALQGLAGAVVSAVGLALIMVLFPEGPDRVKAMGYYGFIMAGGGSIGMLLGGLITDLLNWRWVFLINIPVGVAVCALAMTMLKRGEAPAETPKLDFAGAVTVTAALMIAVYGVVGAEQIGWTHPQTLGLIGLSLVLTGLFLFIESRTTSPLVPLDLFRLRNVSTANVIAVLWAAAMFAWFFLSALYMQVVLGYSPLQVGLAFLPSNLIMAAFSLRLSAWTVNRYGIRRPLGAGLLLAAAGLALFALAPVGGSFLLHILPGMLLLGIGGGMAFNPVLLAAMNDVEEDRAGLASGVVNTAFMMGGALGLAVLASLAATRTSQEASDGASSAEALVQGYGLAFVVGAVCAALGATLAWALIREKPLAPGGSAAH